MKHINEPLPSLRDRAPDLPEEVEAVVIRATAKDPASRYQTAGALAAELRDAVVDRVVSHETRSVSRQRRVPLGRGQMVALAGGALLVLALLVLVATLVTNPPPPPTPTRPAVSAMTAGPVPFTTSFEPDDEDNHGWPISTEGLFTTALADGQYLIQSQAPAQAHTAIYEPDYYVYSSVIVETDGTLLADSQPDSGYGIVFRYENEESYYVFAVNGRQQVSIWLRQNGAWRELRGGPDDWTFDEAVKPAGESNHLSILAVGDHLTGFVNGQRVVDVQDSTIVRGAVGFYIATTVREVDQVLTHVAFDNFTVTNSVPSMSG